MRFDRDFAAYLQARWPTLVRSLVLLGCSQSEAEEVAQEGLARCYLDWGRVREAGDIDVQVYREVLDRLEHARRQEEGAVADPVAEPVSADGAPSDAVLLRYALEEALDRLPEDQRSVVVLRFAAGLSELQVSDLLDLPLEEVDARLAAGLTALDLPTLWEERR